MQPDHDSDDLHALLHEEYGAPRLDDRFSADLIARLQAEAARSPSALVRTRRSPWVMCLGVAAVAALVIAVIWIANPGTPGTNHEVAHRAETDADPRANPPESKETEESGESGSFDRLSVIGERQIDSEALVAREESEVTRESFGQVREPSQATVFSVIPNHRKPWRNISAIAARAGALYVVESGRLYEVNPVDGSYRIVGADDWHNTSAMGAAGGHLYVVSNNQLYEVSPTTGVRRTLGKPDWAETKAIVTVGDMLYISANGLLHRVNPNDGSHEVLHNKEDGTNDPRQRRQ